MKTKEIKIGNLVMASVAVRLIAVAVLCVIALSGCEKKNFEPEWTNYDTVYYEYARQNSGFWTSDVELTPRAAFINVTADEADVIMNDLYELANKRVFFASDSVLIHKSTVHASKEGYMHKEDNGWFVQMPYVEALIKTDVNSISLAEGSYEMLPDWIGADGSVSKGIDKNEYVREFNIRVNEAVLNLLDILYRHKFYIKAKVLYRDYRDGAEIEYEDYWYPMNDPTRIAVDVDSVWLIERK